jgi:hypothetical protein
MNRSVAAGPPVDGGVDFRRAVCCESRGMPCEIPTAAMQYLPAEMTPKRLRSASTPRTFSAPSAGARPTALTTSSHSVQGTSEALPEPPHWPVMGQHVERRRPRPAPPRSSSMIRPVMRSAPWHRRPLRQLQRRRAGLHRRRLWNQWAVIFVTLTLISQSAPGIPSNTSALGK